MHGEPAQAVRQISPRCQDEKGGGVQSVSLASAPRALLASTELRNIPFCPPESP